MPPRKEAATGGGGSSGRAWVMWQLDTDNSGASLAPTESELQKFKAKLTSSDGGPPLCDDPDACCHRQAESSASTARNRGAALAADRAASSQQYAAAPDEMSRAAIECDAARRRRVEPPRMRYRGKRRVVCHVVREWVTREPFDSTTRRISMRCKDNQCVNPSHIQVETLERHRPAQQQQQRQSRTATAQQKRKNSEPDDDDCALLRRMLDAAASVDEDRRARRIARTSSLSYSDSDVSMPQSPAMYHEPCRQGGRRLQSATSTPSQIHATSSPPLSMAQSLKMAMAGDGGIGDPRRRPVTPGAATTATPDADSSDIDAYGSDCSVGAWPRGSVG